MCGVLEGRHLKSLGKDVFSYKVLLLTVSGSHFHVDHNGRLICSLIELVDSDQALCRNENVSGSREISQGLT